MLEYHKLHEEHVQKCKTALEDMTKTCINLVKENNGKPLTDFLKMMAHKASVEFLWEKTGDLAADLDKVQAHRSLADTYLFRRDESWNLWKALRGRNRNGDVDSAFESSEPLDRRRPIIPAHYTMYFPGSSDSGEVQAFSTKDSSPAPISQLDTSSQRGISPVPSASSRESWSRMNTVSTRIRAWDPYLFNRSSQESEESKSSGPPSVTQSAPPALHGDRSQSRGRSGAQSAAGSRTQSGTSGRSNSRASCDSLAPLIPKGNTKSPAPSGNGKTQSPAPSGSKLKPGQS